MSSSAFKDPHKSIDKVHLFIPYWQAPLSKYMREYEIKYRQCKGPTKDSNNHTVHNKKRRVAFFLGFGWLTSNWIFLPALPFIPTTHNSTFTVRQYDPFLCNNVRVHQSLSLSLFYLIDPSPSIAELDSK